MSIKIHIPTPLRPFVGGQDEVVWKNEGSIGQILTELGATHPGLKKHLFDDKNQLRKFVNVYVNDEDIRYQSGADTAVTSGDVVSIVPSIAGG